MSDLTNDKGRTGVRVGVHYKKIYIYLRENGYERRNEIKMERFVVLTKEKVPFLKVTWCSLSRWSSLRKKNGKHLEFSIK